MATYHCNDCDKTLKKADMKRHAHEVHGEGTSTLVYCDMCEYASNRQRDLERHTYRAHHQNKWPTSDMITAYSDEPGRPIQETPNCEIAQAKKFGQYEWAGANYSYQWGRGDEKEGTLQDTTYQKQGSAWNYVWLLEGRISMQR